VLFNAGYNMQGCFLLHPEKRFSANPSCRFRKKRTKSTL